MAENRESDSETSQDEEPVERSCKQIDGDVFLRFYLLICLRNAPPFQSDKSNLTKLYEIHDWATSKNISTFKETYEPNQAILF